MAIQYGIDVRFIDEFANSLSSLNSENCQFIMNNATIHKTSNILEKNINIEFLPPYPLFLYLIEKLFGKQKSIFCDYNPYDNDKLFGTNNNTASQSL